MTVALVPYRSDSLYFFCQKGNDFMSEYALELKALSHRYGKHVALDSLNLQLPPGKIYGLLGRNGAGKTTLLNIMSSAIFASSGKLLLNGQTPHERVDALKTLCFIREKGIFPPTIRVGQVMQTCQYLYPNWDMEYADQLIERFQLNPKKKYKQLSRGMESSLGLIVGLASRAPLTAFDEPSLGLDAVAREAFYDELIHDIELHPRTVIISTHLIDEVSKLFEEVIIIDKGRILTHEPTQQLLDRAYTVTGPDEQVERTVQGKRILHRDVLGGLSIVSVMGDVPVAPEKDVNIDRLSLQKLFVYLTEGGEQ